MKLKKIKHKINIIIICSIVLIIVIAIICLYFIDRAKYNKYSVYESKMDNYGLSKLYNNESSKSYEYVTNIEAIKILIAASYNNSESVFSLQDKYTTDDQWYDYAKGIGVISSKDIDKKYNKKISLIDVYRVMFNAKLNILNLEISNEKTPSFKDYEKYNQKEKYSIKDLVSSGIIDDSINKLDGHKKIRKGELNQLVVKFIEKYTLVESGNLLLSDNENLPNNVDKYPYIIDSVDKDTYEQPFYTNDEQSFLSPIQLYKVEKGNYKSIANMCEDYYNSILNVDYNTINKEDFINNINNLTITEIDENVVQKYVDYVKSNKISISGKATVQIPIIYLDGMNVRVRTKLEFSINNSNTKENLLYLDDQYEQKVIYKDNNIVYIDAVLGYVVSSDKVYNKSRVIYTTLLENYKNSFELIGK